MSLANASRHSGTVRCLRPLQSQSPSRKRLRLRTRFALSIVLLFLHVPSAVAETDGAPSQPPRKAPSVDSAPPAGVRERATAAARERLLELAPLVVQVLNLSRWDPVSAAMLVPEEWLVLLVEGAFDLEAEERTVATKPSSAKQWPIGPWKSPKALAATIKQADPVAVAGLYRALRPRIHAECAKRKASKPRCEGVLRAAAIRLSEPAVLKSVIDPAKTAATPTQRELARLGKVVVVAMRDRVGSVGHRVWGESFSASR